MYRELEKISGANSHFFYLISSITRAILLVIEILKSFIHEKDRIGGYDHSSPGILFS